jgi:hypothetical protein
MSEKKERDPTLVLAQYIFQLGRQTEVQLNEAKGLIVHAYDMGYAAGRSDVEKEMGLDQLAVLKRPDGGTGGTGATAAN